VGPSLLGLVDEGPVLAVLGELGIVLLLLDVGLHLDPHQLHEVRRSAVAMAVGGTVLTLGGAWAAARLAGQPNDTALFLAAALTATSIGIAAREFAGLHRLDTVEARTVLAAAVVDDVLGLLALTVVTRLVVDGSVSIASVAGIVVLAVAYLAVSAVVGVRLAAPFFRGVERLARSPGTPLALALAFTLALAVLADAARLAPLVGAFVAGLALGRTDQGDRIAQDIVPIGHLLIPVFFLRVGVDVDLAAATRPAALSLSAALLIAAVAGKLACGLFASGRPVDRLLLGLGMLPRGEVGLVFAGIGLHEGILDPPRYGALLLTILLTAMATPVLLRRRLRRSPP
jgi:Kef-type K+ transport system membrane component KefB